MALPAPLLNPCKLLIGKDLMYDSGLLMLTEVDYTFHYCVFLVVPGTKKPFDFFQNLYADVLMISVNVNITLHFHRPFSRFLSQLKTL